MIEENTLAIKSQLLKRQSRLEQTTFINIFSLFFSEQIRLDVSSESSARQRIHMKNQALFSLKDTSKKLKCRLLQFLFGALRVKLFARVTHTEIHKIVTLIKKIKNSMSLTKAVKPVLRGHAREDQKVAV